MNNRRKQLMLASAKEYCKCVVEGKTLKYNQIVKNGNFNGTSEWTSSTGTFSVSDNICSFNATVQYGDIRTNVYYGIVVGHKYLVYAEIKTATATSSVDIALYFGYGSPDRIGYVPSNTEWNAVCGIKEANSSQGNSYLVFIRDFRASDRDTIYIRNVMCIDLTKLGLDSISSASDFYETDLGKYIANGNYLPYEPNGKFIHAQSPINFKGVNVWNEQYRGGCYNTNNGDYSSSSSDYEICSKDKIRVKPNTKYYVYCEKVEIGNFAVFYDKNNNFLGYCYYVSNSAEYCIITPENACYMNITFGSDYGNVYKHDICINEYNENYNGKYYKYCGTNVLMEGLVLQKGDKYKSWNGQLVRTMKEIDLSTLTWYYESHDMVWYAMLPSDCKTNDSQEESGDIIAEKYKTSAFENEEDKTICIGELGWLVSGGPCIFVFDSNYNSPTQPSGKILIELINPVSVMWQTLDIQDYNEFVATDTPNIYKLNRDLSDYGVLDVTSDNGTKMSNLTQLNIFGGDGDFCYEDGYIYQKTNDIESTWTYQIQISRAPSRMVSRRTINVESENEIDLDFTKE